MNYFVGESFVITNYNVALRFKSDVARIILSTECRESDFSMFENAVSMTVDRINMDVMKVPSSLEKLRLRRSIVTFEGLGPSVRISSTDEHEYDDFHTFNCASHDMRCNNPSLIPYDQAWVKYRNVHVVRSMLRGETQATDNCTFDDDIFVDSYGYCYPERPRRTNSSVMKASRMPRDQFW